MYSPKKVLVITPTLGSSRHLREAVLSVSTFAMYVDHVLVCPQLQVSRLRDLYRSVEVVGESSQCKGVFDGISEVLRSRAKNYDWFTWINDDDVLLPGFLAVLNSSAQIGSPDVYYGKVEMIDALGNSLLRIPIAKSQRILFSCAKVGKIPLTQQGSLIRVNMFLARGGFSDDLKLTADTELFFKSIFAGDGFQFVDSLVAQYRLQSGQLSADSSRQKAEHDKINSRLSISVSPLKISFVSLLLLATNIESYIKRFRRFGFRGIRSIMQMVSR